MLVSIFTVSVHEFVQFHVFRGDSLILASVCKDVPSTLAWVHYVVVILFNVSVLKISYSAVTACHV